MKISKQSWHYRFNSFTQAKFDNRVELGVFTTCSYIRTTIRSFFQFAWMAAIVVLMVGLLGTVVGSGIYLPIALAFSLPIAEVVYPFAFATYFLIVCAGGQLLFHHYIEPKLYERRERKLGLIRQAMEDKKAGICTIVEFE